MRYWYTLNGIFTRIIRVSSELSVAMRAFCYTFILGLLLKQPGDVTIGFFSFTKDFQNWVSLPVFAFILLDIFHPLSYLMALHFVQFSHFEKYKKYDGNEGEFYKEDLDCTEKLIEPGFFQFLGMTFLPNSLLIAKCLVILWTLLVIIFFIDTKFY